MAALEAALVRVLKTETGVTLGPTTRGPEPAIAAYASYFFGKLWHE